MKPLFALTFSGRVSRPPLFPVCIRFPFLALFWILFPWGLPQAYVLNYSEGPTPARWSSKPDDSTPASVRNPLTGAIRYHLARDGWSETNRSAELNAVRACFDQWQSIPGVQLRFEEGGLASADQPFSTADGTNLIYWTRSDKQVPGSRDDIGASLALTYVSITNGVIQEADMIINGTAYEWFTDITSTNSRQQFVESTVLHEIGHMIGLDHSPIGGATLFPFGLDGVDAQAGLAPDDIAAALALYGDPATKQTLGSIRGRITRQGVPITGAALMLEDLAGNLVSGTLGLVGGSYELTCVPPGAYLARVVPLDPSLARDSLVRGRDISIYFTTNFVETDFMPTTNRPVSLSAGGTVEMDFDVQTGSPPPRITNIRIPSGPLAPSFLSPTATVLTPGQSNVVVGVYSTEFPALGGVLRISGSGIRVGLTSIESGGNLRGRISTIDVLPDALPGLRSYLVEWDDGRVSRAEGFLEIRPRVRDDNFDGLDDLFQRRYFPLFTAASASPDVDPDGDGSLNREEAVAGTNPVSADSVLRIQSVLLDSRGATVRVASVAGRTYRLQFKPDVGAAGWKNTGAAVKASGSEVEILDPGVSDFRFYRVGLVE